MENTMKNKISKISFLFFLELIINFSNVAAQTSTSSPAPVSSYDVLNGSYYDIVIFFLVVIVVLMFSGLHFLGFGEEHPTKQKEKSDILLILKQFVTRSAPIEREHEILLPDDYDGIKELDNQIPPWFNWLFYGSIIFAVLYLLNYHVLSNNKSQFDEYNEEISIASLQRDELIKSGAFVNENTVSQLTDAASLDAGKEIFKANCVACHGPEGGGLVGPNLTDDYWINGGGIRNIFKTIKYGVPAKGMITWQTQLNPKQIQEVSSFVMSLHGTNPVNAKPPQGNKYISADTTNSTKMKINE
jgi:cytochrome c oxidase cbb3-type subunit III